MTVVIAVRCETGVGMASDSQRSFGPEAGLADKVVPFGRGALFGCAGNAPPIACIHDELTRIEYLPEYQDRESLAIAVRVATDQANKHRRGGPEFAVDVLAGGVDEAGRVWLASMDANGLPTERSADRRAAIGFGSYAALGAYEALLPAGIPTLEEGAEVARLVVEAAIRSSSTGVGGPVQLWVADADGARDLGAGGPDAVAPMGRPPRFDSGRPC